MRKVFRKLVSVDEARKHLEILLSNIKLSKKKVRITEAYGYTLAEDIKAKIDIPSFSRATKDGYAVRYKDVAKARENMPIKLKMIGYSKIGTLPSVHVGSGEAVAIDTGAAIPSGADSVVMEEYTEKEGDYVKVYKAVRPGENIQQVGSDIFRGEVILRKGTIISTREIGILASLGISEVEVYVKPKFCIFSLGDELISQGEAIRPGCIYDVNGPMITSLLCELGFKAVYKGILPDDIDEITHAINESLRECDILITSGATSVGIRDLLINVISQIGDSEVVFHGVKQRPGSPTLLAKVKGKVLIGLPGFPVSALMTFYNIVLPALMRVYELGSTTVEVDSILGSDVRGDVGYINLYPVVIRRRGREIYSYPLFTESGAIATLQQSDGYLLIPEEKLLISKGERVKVILFSKYIRLPDIVVVSSHCIALDNLLNEFIKEYNYHVKRIWVGSMGAIEGIKLGYADVGGIHLLHEATGEYNIPYLRELDIKNIILYRGYIRRIGFVVGKGNPHNIRLIDDIIEKKVRFINRNPGSGTRTLIDRLIKEYCLRKGVNFEDVVERIDGYNLEAKTHEAVVTYVDEGLADVGVAIEAATVNRNVDFIPISKEYFDFLVSKERLSDKEVQDFISFIFGDKGKEILTSIPGISIDSDFGKKLLET